MIVFILLVITYLETLSYHIKFMYYDFIEPLKNLLKTRIGLEEQKAHHRQITH